jgi:hypothetical protein
MLSPRKNLSDDVFDRDFLDVDVADGQFVQQRLANRDDAVAFDLELDASGSLLDDFAVIVMMMSLANKL